MNAHPDSGQQPPGAGFRESLTLPAEPGRELAAANRALELALELGLGMAAAEEVRLAVIEGVINAIEHGRGSDGLVRVTFGLERRPPRLTVIVADAGPGFDPARVEIPRLEHKLRPGARKRGWGLAIMRSLMDEVRIESSPEGTRLTLVRDG